MIDETSGIIGWPIGQQYREQAASNEARIKELIKELMQRANHWHDTAEMLKRQRNTAEEQRDGWKERALKSEQQRQSLRDLLIIAEGQRDQAKIDAEHWKGEWAVVMGQLGGARAEVEALRKVYEAAKVYCGNRTVVNEPALIDAVLTVAMAVQPTTGDKHE